MPYSETHAILNGIFSALFPCTEYAPLLRPKPQFARFDLHMFAEARGLPFPYKRNQQLTGRKNALRKRCFRIACFSESALPGRVIRGCCSGSSQMLRSCPDGSLRGLRRGTREKMVPIYRL